MTLSTTVWLYEATELDVTVYHCVVIATELDDTVYHCVVIATELDNTVPLCGYSYRA